MSHSHRVLGSLFLGLLLHLASGQKSPTPPDSTWTLQECVTYAQEQNLNVKRTQLQARQRKNDLQSAQWNYAPSISGGFNYGWNFGLNIDPVTNEISQANRQTANLQAQASWNIYQGGRLYNTISRSQLDYRAALADYEQAQYDIGLNVASAYLQILLNQEIADVAAQQVQNSQAQVRRTRNLVEAGAAPQGDLLQLEAQLARDEQSLVEARNQVRISELQLANILQLEDPQDFAIADPDIPIPSKALVSRSPEGIFQTALDNQPQVKAARLRQLSREKSIKIAQAGYLPSLSLVAQVGTNYSDQIPDVVDTREELVPIGQVQSTGQLVTTLQPQVFPVTDGTKPLNDQVSDNVNEFVGVNLNIPIFNRMTVRNQVQNAEIGKRIADLNYQQTVNELRQTIYQAHADAKSAYQSLRAARKSENASQKALEYARERFEVGALNQLDFETARNNYTQARSQLLQARYDFIFRMKVLEFYLTNQVVLQDE